MQKLSFAALASLLLIGLVSCGQPSASLEQLAPPQAISATVPPADDPPSTSASSPDEVTVAAQVDACLACHTDKQQLIDTAKPEEVVPSESSGVG